MKSFIAIVSDEIGIHARPASVVISSASKFESDLQLITTKDNKQANLKSVMQVLSLAVRYEAEIKVTAEGSDEDEAIEHIKASMVKNGIIKSESIRDSS